MGWWDNNPTRIIFDGDTDYANELAMDYARPMMFDLKNMMKTGIQQNSLKTVLPDGSTVQVQSAFGQDHVIINAVTLSPSEEVTLPTYQTVARILYFQPNSNVIVVAEAKVYDSIVDASGNATSVIPSGDAVNPIVATFDMTPYLLGAFRYKARFDVNNKNYFVLAVQNSSGFSPITCYGFNIITSPLDNTKKIVFDTILLVQNITLSGINPSAQLFDIYVNNRICKLLYEVNIVTGPGAGLYIYFGNNFTLIPGVFIRQAFIINPGDYCLYTTGSFVSPIPETIFTVIGPNVLWTDTGASIGMFTMIRPANFISLDVDILSPFPFAPPAPASFSFNTNMNYNLTLPFFLGFSPNTNNFFEGFIFPESINSQIFNGITFTPSPGFTISMGQYDNISQIMTTWASFSILGHFQIGPNTSFNGLEDAIYIYNDIGSNSSLNGFIPGGQ